MRYPYLVNVTVTVERCYRVYAHSEEEAKEDKALRFSKWGELLEQSDMEEEEVVLIELEED